MSKIFEPSLSKRQPVAGALFEAACLRGKSAHAFLLTGRGTQDKWLLASQLACYLNCTDDEKDRLGSCRVRAAAATGGATMCLNCDWISQDRHPQAWATLTGEGKTGKIPVEKSRLLAAELSRTSQFARVVVVPDASEQVFHRPAANALLKTIEEPGDRCLFLFFAPHQEDVLATIVSRCQVLPVLKSAASGFWSPEIEPADPGEYAREVECARNLVEQMPAPPFIGNKPTKPASGSDTLDWVHRLADLESDNVSAELIIDLIAAREAERLRSAAANQPELSWYLKRIFELSESSKEQIEHYVPVRPALEAFAISLRSLSHQERRLSP